MSGGITTAQRLGDMKASLKWLREYEAVIHCPKDVPDGAVYVSHDGQRRLVIPRKYYYTKDGFVSYIEDVEENINKVLLYMKKKKIGGFQ